MKNNIKKLLISFMLLQPIFDIYYLYSDNIINIFKFSPSTIIRIIIFLILLMLTVFSNQEKINRKKSIAFLSIYFIYIILHQLNATNFNVTESINNNYSTLKELFYIVRMLVPIFLIYITYNQEINFNDLKKVIFIVLNIFCLTIIVTNLLKISITSYYQGSGIIKANFFEWFNSTTYKKYGYELVASKGIFHMANQISGTIIILYPILMYVYFTEKLKFINVYTMAITDLTLLMLGTRTAAYGCIIVNVVMLSGYILFNTIVDRKKLDLRKIAYFAIIFAAFFVILPHSPVENRTYAEDRTSTITENLKDEKSQNEYKQILVSKDIEKKKEFIVKNYRLYGLDETFLFKNYPYQEDYEFWLKLMGVPYGKRANHRQLEALTTKRVMELNDNKYDYLFGIGFSRLRNSKIYLERDIFVHLYSIGILGAILLVMPYAIIGIYSFVRMVKERKFNYLNCTLLLCIGLAYSCGIFSGNIFDEWIVTLFLAFICGNLLININNPKKYYQQCKDNKKVLFISSTGGHLNELMQLKPLFKKYDYSLITEKTKSNLSLKDKYNDVHFLVYGTKDHKLSYIFKFLYNCIKSIILYIKIRPKVIVTTGTHTAVPICYIGKFFGTKIIFIETFANSETKTLSGKLIYPIADTFIVQWESMLKLYPKAIYGGWIY